MLLLRKKGINRTTRSQVSRLAYAGKSCLCRQVLPMLTTCLCRHEWTASSSLHAGLLREFLPRVTKWAIKRK